MKNIRGSAHWVTTVFLLKNAPSPVGERENLERAVFIFIYVKILVVDLLGRVTFQPQWLFSPGEIKAKY